jgi:hypothetical protein
VVFLVVVVVVAVVVVVNVTHSSVFFKWKDATVASQKRRGRPGLFAVEVFTKMRGRWTQTAKRTPNLGRLALGFTVFMDNITAKVKPESINARYANRGHMATSV